MLLGYTLNHLGVELLLWIPVQRNQTFLETPEQCELVLPRPSACLWCFRESQKWRVVISECVFWEEHLPMVSAWAAGHLRNAMCPSWITFWCLSQKPAQGCFVQGGNTSGSSRLTASISNVLCTDRSSKGRKWSDRSHCNDQWITVWHYSRWEPLGTGFLKKCKLYQ